MIDDAPCHVGHFSSKKFTSGSQAWYLAHSLVLRDHRGSWPIVLSTLVVAGTASRALPRDIQEAAAPFGVLAITRRSGPPPSASAAYSTHAPPGLRPHRLRARTLSPYTSCMLIECMRDL